MTDRELFHRAAGELPAAVLPVGGSLFVRSLLKGVVPGGLFLAVNSGVKHIWEMSLDDTAVISALLCVPFFLLMEVAAVLLTLGAFRWSLRRAEGIRSGHPWTIFSQWRQYRGWVLWVGVVPILWEMGKQGSWIFFGRTMTDTEFARFNMYLFYCNAVFTLLTHFLIALLVLSVRTAYLRAPERGFWRAVGFGVKEGLRKWPRTIGAQIKFVIPAQVAVVILNVLIRKMAIQTGISSVVDQGLRGLLGLAAETWILVFYGQLAAQRYDPPAEKEESHVSPLRPGGGGAL